MVTCVFVYVCSCTQNVTTRNICLIKKYSVFRVFWKFGLLTCYYLHIIMPAGSRMLICFVTNNINQCFNKILLSMQIN
jgi:hypothetical protein